MNFNQWLDEESGRVKSLAEHFECTPSAISQWRTNGVPRNHIKAVHELTGGAVSIESLVYRDSATVQPTTA